MERPQIEARAPIKINEGSSHQRAFLDFKKMKIKAASKKSSLEDDRSGVFQLVEKPTLKLTPPSTAKTFISSWLLSFLLTALFGLSLHSIKHFNQ